MSDFTIAVTATVGEDWANQLSDQEAGTVLRAAFGPDTKLKLTQKRQKAARGQPVSVELSVKGYHPEGPAMASTLAAAFGRIGKLTHEFVFNHESNEVVRDRRFRDS